MESTASIRDSLALEVRVVRALLMREVITRFGRHNLGVLWIVCEPIIFTVGVATLWTFSGLHAGSPIPIVAFAVTGYSSVLMWRNGTSRCAFALEQNKPLLFHRNVRPIDVFLTRILLEAAGATGSFTLLSLLFMFIGWMPPPVDLAQVVFGWIMLAWLTLGLALTIGAGTAFSEVVERLWHPAAYLLFPLSGAAFMVDWLPREAQKYVLLVPMVHITEMIREGWFGNLVQTHYSLGYLTTWCLVLSLSGLYITWEASRRVEIY